MPVFFLLHLIVSLTTFFLDLLLYTEYSLVLQGGGRGIHSKTQFSLCLRNFQLINTDKI